MTTVHPDTILTVPQVCQRLSLSEPTLRRYAAAGMDGFPRKIKLGARRIGYSSRDVAEYIERQRAAAQNTH